jgi:hypothetical protein
VSTPIPATAGFRFFYIDDSGAPDTGYVVYSWIEVTPQCWAPGLRYWLDLRKTLYTDYQVGADEELHATAVYGGRGMPSSSRLVNTSKKRRHELLERAVQAIGANADINVGTVYRHTTARGKAYTAQRAALYDDLISHLDQRLIADGEYASIFMDGNGSDPTYFRAHRNLPLAGRRVLEDPLFQLSHVSQWVQMADLVAWTTYQSILRHPGKVVPAAWYDQHLRVRDVNGGPIAL